MGADSFIKSQMHRMPTYDEVIYDTVIKPTDRINLPDRTATRLRNTHQLTRFDEVDETPNLGAEQDKITQERLKHLALQGMGVGPDETVALKRAQMERDHKATQTGSAQTASSSSKHYTGQDPSLLASTRKQTPPTSDTRNILQRGIDRIFVDPPTEPYVIRWNPIADGIKEHQKEQHDFNTRQAHLKSLRGTAASKTSQTSREVRDHLEATSSHSNPLAWMFNKPKVPEYDIGTPPGSVSTKKAASIAGSTHSVNPTNMASFLRKERPDTSWINHARSKLTLP